MQAHTNDKQMTDCLRSDRMQVQTNEGMFYVRSFYMCVGIRERFMYDRLHE